MVTRHTVTHAIGIAVLGLLSTSHLSRAAGQARVPIVQTGHPGANLKDGGMVEFCADAGACKISKHPIATGTVRQIVSGDFISGAKASWIALSDRSVNLCYLAASTSSITCTPVTNGPDLIKGIQIAYIDLDDGTRTLRFTAKPGERETSAANYNPYPFMAGVSAAAEVLQRHVARHSNSNTDPTYSAKLLAEGNGADVCAIIDGGGVTCSSTDGQVAPENVDGGGNHGVASQTPSASPTRLGDPNAITQVDIETGTRPTVQTCTNARVVQMKDCNGPRLDEKGYRICVTKADSNFQECVAEARYNANLNR